MNLRRTLCRAVLAASMAALATPGYAAPASTEGSIDTPDGTLYYERLGAGPPVVLIAGGPGASRISLRPEFDRLAATHTVVYFDNIGRGRSSPLPEGRRHSPERDADDVERLRQGLGLGRVALIGHSYGSLPALAYAARHPGSVSRLVVSSGGHGAVFWQRNIDSSNAFVENQYPEVWSRLLALRARGVKSCAKEYQDVYGEATGDMYWYDLAAASRRKPFSTDPRDGFRREVYCDMIGDESEVKVGGAMASFDIRPALADVRVPTFISVGRYDRIAMPKTAFEICDAFPPGVARVRVFERSGHRPWVEEADDFFNEVEQFLKPAATPSR